MEDVQKLSRRDFLRLSAVTAASAMLAACGGTATTPQGGATTTSSGAAGTTAPGAAATTGGAAPGGGAAATSAATTVAAPAATPAGVALENGTAVGLAAPSTRGEAPMLAELVKAGKLPSLDQRLPKNPYVVPHAWMTIGKYGGTLQTSSAGGEWGLGHYVQESMYGNAMLRYLKDGQEVGPGLIESWQPNADTSQWTFHFRQGLKWSDGQPWTVDDILYWWNELVNNPDSQEGLPDVARSGKGTPATFKKVDDYTLQMSFDAPAPLTADVLATWVQSGIGFRFMAPKHYLQQFNPKLNPKLKPHDFTEHSKKMDFANNPDCPTMTGWRLKTYVTGQRAVWERNPYYWCVDKAGNQLPYMDAWNVTHYQDAQVQKVGFLEGKVDFVNSGFTSLFLSDVQALKQAEPKSKLEVRLWDSGSGTGSIFFFNQDYKDPKMRQLIRMPEFRKALSHAFNRPDAQKSIYFNTGELTTGTYSPKSIEYNINDQGKSVYASWRDSAITYDPALAKSMLDKIGVKVGPGGKRTMPDGSKLTVFIEYSSDTGSEHLSKNQLLARDWQAIGLDAKLNPLPPSAYSDRWNRGEGMSKTDWEASDGPNHLVNPTWLVPIEVSRWAPLEGTFYTVRGTPKEKEEQNVDPYQRKPPRMDAEKGGPIEQLWKLYDQSKAEPDFMKRTQLVWQMVKVHVDKGPFFMGVVANYPRIILVKDGLKNVPKREDLALHGYVNTWIHPTPAAYDPEAWFFDNPAAHK